MNLRLEGHSYRYAVEQCQLVFFPEERPVFSDADADAGAASAVSRLSSAAHMDTATTRIAWRGAVFSGTARSTPVSGEDKLVRDRRLSHAVKLSFYRAACRATGVRPPWGSLTGIRPAGMLLRMRREGLTMVQADRLLRDRYDVTDSRRALCKSAAISAERVMRILHPLDISLYIGIPFCPTRCSYCTFVSHAVEKAGHLLPPFLEHLPREMAALADVVSALGLRPVTLYIGGGTPTTLSDVQLDEMMRALAHHFDLSYLREYTVEAGRPDTVTAAKLDVMKRHGVTRVSINPQSMQDTILAGIGRPHTAKDVRDAFVMARSAGLAHLNMDLIAGLPGDTSAGFSDSLAQVLALAPDNITIHTLARKKGAHLAGSPLSIPASELVEDMLLHAYARLPAQGYGCYYLYRQKYMAGQFENTGWARPGVENMYNICMMEELHSVLSLGGGGVSKLVDVATGRIERVFNPKYPYEYLSGFAKILDSKRSIHAFYESKAMAVKNENGRKRNAGL